MELIIFSKSYTEEDLADMERDIYESLDYQENDAMAKVPEDRGQFIVSIIWNDK